MPRGQNQPVSVMAQSTAPMVTPQGVKIAVMTPMPAATAVRNGQMLPPSEALPVVRGRVDGVGDEDLAHVGAQAGHDRIGR